MQTPELLRSVEPQELSLVAARNRDDVMAASQRLQTIVQSVFPYSDDLCTPQWVKNKEERPREILRRIIGTSRTRIGPEPNESAKEGLLIPIRRAVEQGLPMQLVTVWGTSRDTKNPEANDAELADFSAFMMIKAAVDRIRAVHPPGAVIRVFEEDTTCAWLDTKDLRDTDEVREVWNQMDRYWNTKTKLFHVLTGAMGQGIPIEFVRESDLLTRMGITASAYFEGCAAIKPLFFHYLKESDEIMKEFITTKSYDSWEQARECLTPEVYQKLWEECEGTLTKLKSLSELKQTGWIGSITPEMRAFYAKKHAKLDPTLEYNYDGRLQTMAHYFSSTCYKAALGTLNFGLLHPETAVKVPLTLVPNGRPAEFNQLVLLRSIPKDTNKGLAAECMAPWLGRTYLSRDGILHIGNLHHREATSERVPVLIHLNNTPVKTGIHPMDYPIPSAIELPSNQK